MTMNETCSACGSRGHVAHSAREWGEIIAISGVTKGQIRALRAEAEDAGDDAQVALCDAAIGGSDCAYCDCIDAIRAAEAQDRYGS